ncbi:MAG: hypothetical protein ACI4RA_08090 [Kiritimatiellia bacterium]
MNKQLHFTPQASEFLTEQSAAVQKKALGKARVDAFMAKFAGYEKLVTYRRRYTALGERQAKSLAKDLSGERKGGLEELRAIPGFIENESSIRKENALHLAMMEAKKRSGLNQTEIAARLGMPQPNVSRIEHSEIVTFHTFAAYLFACGFDFTIRLRRAEDGKTTRVSCT